MNSCACDCGWSWVGEDRGLDTLIDHHQSDACPNPGRIGCFLVVRRQDGGWHFTWQLGTYPEVKTGSPRLT